MNRDRNSSSLLLLDSNKLTVADGIVKIGRERERGRNKGRKADNTRRSSTALPKDLFDMLCENIVIF